MSKIWLHALALLSVLSFANASGNNDTRPQQNGSEALTGTLQKMIVENASVTMQLDVNGLNGSNSLVARPVTLEFTAAANSFFPVLVFDDLLRVSEPGSMALIPSRSSRVPALPAQLSASLGQLVLEKRSSGEGSNFTVRDGNTGFTFFNVEGHQYSYDATAQSLKITGGRLIPVSYTHLRAHET